MIKLDLSFNDNDKLVGKYIIENYDKDDKTVLKQDAMSSDIDSFLKLLNRKGNAISNVKILNAKDISFVLNTSTTCTTIILRNIKKFKNDVRFNFIFDVYMQRKLKLVRKKVFIGAAVIGLASTFFLTKNKAFYKQNNNPINDISVTYVDDTNDITKKQVTKTQNNNNINENTTTDNTTTLTTNAPTTSVNITQDNNDVKPNLIDISKYKSNAQLGFVVTCDNKKYSLSSNDKDLLTAIVAAECDKTLDDALAVISTILNRCEDPSWISSYGSDPISQATARNQFVVYQQGYYIKFLGNAPQNVVDAVNDALNGVRNHGYLSFRSNGIKSYSDNKISDSGNRYK